MQFINEGKLRFEDPNGTRFQWEKFDSAKGKKDGVFLIHDLQQLRGLVGPFSEVALDLVEYSPDKVVFHSPPAGFLWSETNSKGLITFALIKSAYWRRLLFDLREIVYMQWEGRAAQGEWMRAAQVFPLPAAGHKAIEIHADGRVKIRNA
ncbi:hypothetical protein [Cyclobacterium xiamenense]|jgi:hypothetical protein|uniref:hypothetical protein n=1 Tax=Cyclobacterium xiamenense TaxID=1297121 RepID=UPI0035CE9CF2